MRAEAREGADVNAARVQAMPGRARRRRASGDLVPLGFAAVGLLVVGLIATDVTPAAAESAGAVSWGTVAMPAPPPARVIGKTSLGCLAGAQQLPLQGPGWQVMRPSRLRYFGHPETIAFLVELAADAHRQGGALLIGDIAQPRGGPMSSGHRSHQTGLDVDIWFRAAPPREIDAVERETMPAVSMLAAGATHTDADVWGPWQAWLVQRVASDPRVDRIFVNPAIKRTLCEAAGGSVWLQRVRPWWGHDHHLHVRLACPSGETACVGDPPLPEGDGCDVALEWWFSAEAEAERLAKRPPQPPTMEALPEPCDAVLNAR